MTDKTTNKGGADAGSTSALIALDSSDEQADLPEELTEVDDFPEGLTEIDDADSGGGSVLGTGAVTGGFGFAGLALAIVSLTTNWTSGVVVSHGQYSAEMNAPSSGLTVQQDLNMYGNAWHTQGWWALVFAAAAVLFGAGALLWPRIRRGGDPGLGQGGRDRRDHRGSGRRGPRGAHPCRGVRRAPDRPDHRELSRAGSLRSRSRALRQ